MIYLYFVLFLLPFYSFGASSDPFQVEIAVDHHTLTLGESLTVTAYLKYPENYTIDIQTLINQLLWTANPTAPQFLLKKKTISKDQKKLEFILEPLTPGPHYITFLNINFNTISERFQNHTIPSQVIKIEVQSSDYNTNFTLGNLHPLAPEMPYGLTQVNRFDLIESPKSQLEEAQRNISIIKLHSFPWIPLIFFIGILVVLWGASRLRDYLKEKKRAQSEAGEAFLWAKSELNALESKKFVEQRQFKTYFASLKEIGLTFLERRHQIRWQSRTINELAQLTSTNPKEIHYRNQLIAFLNLTDQVEFAGHIPTEAECTEALATTYSILY